MASAPVALVVNNGQWSLSPHTYSYIPHTSLYYGISSRFYICYKSQAQEQDMCMACVFSCMYICVCVCCAIDLARDSLANPWGGWVLSGYVFTPAVACVSGSNCGQLLAAGGLVTGENEDTQQYHKST